MSRLELAALGGSVLLLISCGYADKKEADQKELDTGLVEQAASQDEHSRIRAWAAQRNPAERDVVDRIVVGNKEFDCVPFESQASVRGTGLTRAQVKAPPEPDIAAAHVDTRAKPGSATVAALEESGARSCPEGTVRLHRYSQRELAQFRTLEEVEEYYQHPPHVIQCSLTPSRYYETYQSEFDSPVKGAHTEINLDTSVQVAFGHTIGQMWLTVNHHPCVPKTTSVETIESGWIKRPGASAEMFVYYTPDGYQSGCFNSSCTIPGFTRVGSSGLTPGGNISSGWIQMAWHLYRPGNEFGVTPGWWFYANGWVGYYSLSLFDAGMEYGVTSILAGGEILANSGNQMGNGSWGDASGAAYVDKYWYLDWDHYYKYMPNAYYWGDGRYASSSNGKYYVDGREVLGWWVTGTYSIPIDSSKSYFRYGGPGP